MIFFDVLRTGSPDPLLGVRLAAKHEGRTTTLELTVPGIANHQAVAIAMPALTVLALLALLTVAVIGPIKRLAHRLRFVGTFA